MPNLENGAVLPHGLLSENDSSMMGGFNKSYRNFPLRVGVIVGIYPVNDPNNVSNLTTEYDVLVIEQNEDKGATPIRYKNCMSSEGLGSIADYFERNLRPLKTKTTPGNSVNLSGQDGAVVLLLCLDGMSDKAIIISALTNPGRPTNLTSTDPYLQGEYNGVQVIVNSDGSCSLTFKGATDNSGDVIDSSQTPTAMTIEKDGSFQVMHDMATLRLDKSGTVTLDAKKDLAVTVSGKATINVQGDTTINAQGKVNVMSGGDTVVNSSGDVNVTASGKAVVKATEVDVQGSTGQVLTNVTDPVVDTIFGEPTMGVTTFKAG